MDNPVHRHVLSGALIAITAAAAPALGQCDPLTDYALDWTVGATAPGPFTALASYNDGDGPRLYAGGPDGLWSYAEGRWTAVYEDPKFGVHDLLVHNDGSGAKLYIANDINVLSYDGSLDLIGAPTGVFCLAEHDFDNDGSPELFIGGSFTSVSGVPADSAAYWDGSSWTGFTGPMDGVVRDLTPWPVPGGMMLATSAGVEIFGNDTVRDDILLLGSMHAVTYYEGNVLIMGGVNGIIGEISGNVDGTVYDVLVWDDGTGEKLYVAGDFDEVTGGGPTGLGGVAVYDGSWSALDTGVNGASPGEVRTLDIFRESAGAGYSVYAAGDFTTADGDNIARWGCEIPDPGIVGNKWDHTNTFHLADAVGAHYSEVDDALYVGRRNNTFGIRGLYRIDMDDTATLIWSGDDIISVEIDDAGNIYTTDDFSGEIYRVDHGTTTRQVWVSGWHSGDDDPVGMAFLPTGASPEGSFGPAFMIDRGNSGPDEIWNWSPDSSQGETVLHADNGTLDDALDITADAEGNVWVVDTAGANPGVIYEVDGLGNLTPLTLSENIESPAGVVADPLWNELLVLDAASGDKEIVRVDKTTGQVTDLITGFVFSGGTTWACIDISADGTRLYVTDGGAGRIYEFTRVYDCPPGNVNGDEITDYSDTNIITGDWGCTGCSCAGDTNSDCVTDLKDLALALSNLFAVCPTHNKNGLLEVQYSMNVYPTPWPDTPPDSGTYYTVDLIADVSGTDRWTAADFTTTVVGDGTFWDDPQGGDEPLQGAWSNSPNLEYDSWYAAPPDFASLPAIVPGTVVNDPQSRQAVWWDATPFDGPGQYVYARYTIRLSDAEAADGLRLTSKLTETPYLNLAGNLSTANLADSLVGLNWNVYATEECDGDLDGDGETTGNDLINVALNLDAGGPNGDVDGDNDTDRDDVAIVLADYGCPDDVVVTGGIVTHDIVPVDNTSVGADPSHPEFMGGVTHFTFDLQIILGDDVWTTTQATATLTEPGYSWFQHTLGGDDPPLGASFTTFPALEFDTFFTRPDALDTGEYIFTAFLTSTSSTFGSLWFQVAPPLTEGTIARYTIVVPEGSPAPEVVPQGTGNGTVIGTIIGSTTVASTVTFQYGPFAADIVVDALPTCPVDCANGDGVIGIEEFLAVLGTWGQTGVPCDLNDPGVGIDEFLTILGLWGPCP